MSDYDKRMFDARLLDSTALNSNARSAVVKLGHLGGFGATVDLTDQGSYAGVLFIEVANGTQKQRDREIEDGFDVLPWQTYGPIASSVPSSVSVSSDTVTLSGNMSFGINISDVTFDFIRLRVTTSAGTAAIDVIGRTR
jgi:hypothetical protein